MEGQFCKPEASSTIEPKAPSDAYSGASKVFEGLLRKKDSDIRPKRHLQIAYPC